MQTISPNLASSVSFALDAGLSNSKSGIDGAFEAILAEINASQGLNQAFGLGSSTSSPKSASQQASSRSEAAQTTAAASSRSKASNLPEGTPIQQFKQSLEQSDEPLESFKVSAEDKPKLKAALVKSGYSEKQADEVLKRASDEDGSVNLATFFNLLEEYQPLDGPVFAIESQDAPLLIQLLKELGVGEDDLNNWLASLPSSDGKIMVRGLPQLLQKASAGSEGFQVDRSILSDLLGKLGLNENEVQALLSKATDGQGRTNPKAMLAMLQEAANKQDLGMGQVMRELAARMKITPDEKKLAGQSKLSAASEIRAKVIKALQEQTGLEQTKSADLKDALKTTLNLAGEGDLLDSTQAGAQKTEAGQNAAQAGLAQSQLAKAAAQAKGAAQAGNQSEVQGVKPAQADAQMGAVKVSAAQAGTKAAGQAAQTAQTRGSLPSYVVRQVADQMTQMVQKQQNTLNLKLKPAHLGNLNLEISVKDGTVKAVMMAETAAAKLALDSGLDQLKQVLGQQGLKLERLEVMVNPDAQRQSQFAAGDQNDSRRNRGGGESSGDGAAGGVSAVDNEAGPGVQVGTGLDGERINLFA